MSFLGIGGKSLKEEMKNFHDKAIAAEFSDWYRNFFNKEEDQDCEKLCDGSYSHNRKRHDPEKNNNDNDDAAMLAMGVMLNGQAAQ